MSYKCKKCNSSDVEGKYWCNHNTGKIIDPVEDGNYDNWCVNCQELVEIYDDELLTKEELAKQLGWSYELWKGEERLGDNKEDVHYWYDQEGNGYSEEEFNNIKKENL